MEMSNRSGCCRFCGQVKFITAPEGLEQDRVNEIITNECRCEESAELRAEVSRREEIERSIEQGEKAIKMLFGEDWEMAAEIFISQIRKVATGDVASISLKHEDADIRGSISRKADGSIRVTRKDATTRTIG